MLLSFVIILITVNVAVVLFFKRKLRQIENVYEEHKFQLAEANLALLENSEKLEMQQEQLAEANLTLLEQKEIIEEERTRSEKLLLNILPVKVADELKKNGKTEPDYYEDVSVFFSDLVNFTKISESISPKELINELNELFTAFDQIIEKHQCERIKTIGDAYLCVCGMPEKNPDHASNIIKSALEIIDYLKARNEHSDIKWQIRIGIHSGKVVGGVVGVKKYIYDVFGDTINMASRLESHSEPMKVNISDKTYQLIKKSFNCQERQAIDVKGKGRIDMFYVDGCK